VSRHASTRCAAALAVAVIALAALSPARAAAAPGPAPAFTLERLDGQTLSLADYRGSPVILLFWAPW
jgi:cytochrome c biogenesis protein CcmG, thiol:disulfide interchange protein DsbE